MDLPGKSLKQSLSSERTSVFYRMKPCKRLTVTPTVRKGLYSMFKFEMQNQKLRNLVTKKLGKNKIR